MASFNVENNLGQITQEAGDLSAVLGGPLSGAVSKVQNLMRGLNTVIAANPIAALLIVITALVTFVASKFQPVIDRASAVMSALNAAFDFGIDLLGSWLGLTERSGLSLAETTRMAYELERASQALQDRQIELITVQAELNAVSREALLVSSDQTLSEEERIDALTRAGDAIRQRFINDRQVLEEEIRILRARQALGSNLREDNEELARLEAALINIRADEASQLKEINGQLSGLEKTISAKADADLKEAQALRDKAEAQRLSNAERQRAIQLADLDGALQIQVAQGILTETQARERQVEVLQEQLQAAQTRDERIAISQQIDAQNLAITLSNITEEQQALEDAEIRREEQQTREIELLEAREATEEEIFQARLDRAETQDQREQILHERTLFRIAAEIEADKVKAQNRIDQEQRAVDALGGIGVALQSFADESKGLAIAGIITDTAASVASQIANFEVGKAKSFSELGPILGGIAAVAVTAQQVLSIGATVAAGQRGIQAIQSGSFGGASAPSSSVGGPTVSTPTFANTGAPVGTETGFAASSPEMPIFAVVTDGDVNDSSERTARTRRRTRLNRNGN